MKSFGFVHVLLILILLLAYQCAGAQDFVATNRGDTLRGDIKVFNFGVEKKVQVTNADNKKVSIPLLQVKSFHVDNEIFRPQKGPNGYVFMKVLKSGFLSLYAFQLENQTTYDGYLLVKKDGTSTEVPNLNFKKVVKRFVSECPDVAEKIEEGEYGRKSLNEIIDAYNACVDSRTEARHQQNISVNEVTKKAEPWSILEDKIKSHDDFASKADALEMISEIRGKVSRNEKVPNFLYEGLKNAVSATSLREEVEKTIAETK